jgi:CTP synthase
MESAGLIVAGTNPERDLVEIVEVKDHPWFVAVQFHPEFQSKPTKAHPLFAAFIEATLTRKLLRARQPRNPNLTSPFGLYPGLRMSGIEIWHDHRCTYSPLF